MSDKRNVRYRLTGIMRNRPLGNRSFHHTFYNMTDNDTVQTNIMQYR